MRYFFVVQGEGRGHLTQAISLLQILERNGHEVIEVLVGRCSNRELPQFFTQKMGERVLQFDSPSFDYGKKGKKGKIFKTIVKNTTIPKLAKWRRSIEFINDRIEERKPDVIINFYEMLLGFTSLIYKIRVPIVSIAHQFLIDHPDYHYRPASDPGFLTLRLCNMLCSFGTTKTLALSFYPLKDYYRDRMAVLPPLLREEIFYLKPTNGEYILGYMVNPTYLDEVKAWHRKNPNIKLNLFWDKKDAQEVTIINDNITLHKISDTKFINFMQDCKGYVTTAGFESVCEAMYLGKPILMIPVHIEQEINANDAISVGAGAISSSFDITKLIEFAPNYNADTQEFKKWVESAEEQFLRHLTTLV